MLVLRWVISVLCAIGFYASVFMLRKSMRADRGALPEPSVVQTPRAKLFAGIPNAAFGSLYYPVLLAIVWSTQATVFLALAAAGTLCAAATSAYLAYSLLFVTRRSCAYCWTAHAANWSLLVAIAWLFVRRG